MKFTDSLEKENIRLSQVNQIRVAELAESLDVTPDKLVNDLIYTNTANKYQYTKDLLWMCQSRIAEIEEELKTVKFYEKPAYLTELDRYRFMERVLTSKKKVKEVIEDDDDEE